MNIVIIGCGYVGLAVAKYWRQNSSFNITVTTTTPERVSSLESIADKVIVTTGDDLEGLKSATENQDVVLLTVAPKGGIRYQETYLNTAQNLVTVLQQNSTVKQLIYTSTFSIYGDRNGEWVDEDTPLQPTTSKGEILQATEEALLQGASDKLRVCILRLAGIYGDGRELIKIFSRFAGKTRAGSGGEIANWIHLDDIVSAIEFVRNQQLQGVFNLLNDANITNKELLDTLLSKYNLPLISWDSSVKSDRLYNARVSNQKIKAAGYQLIHPQIIF
ncbi:NAD(P)-dependent oxidoreductase [Nostoc sp. CENA543]|uniref:SDR family oxidoreductase n=1 Tax=Nostoc sp. CENA543 TaxID=1869241 RepID=UPI000CA2252D|nr:SDR family oxidoreductase [Nostoc sp. CENA543]AUT01764.1 NAD(P)-dependent oxidoreductase [Nostoc sp. CENA543]